MKDVPSSATGAVSRAEGAGGQGSPEGPQHVNIARKVTCPVCSTTFSPRGTAGKCPVCGEQVLVADALAGDIPVISPMTRWLTAGGNWRMAVVLAIVLYQIILFVILWVHLARIHALVS